MSRRSPSPPKVSQKPPPLPPKIPLDSPEEWVPGQRLSRTYTLPSRLTPAVRDETWPPDDEWLPEQWRPRAQTRRNPTTGTARLSPSNTTILTRYHSIPRRHPPPPTREPPRVPHPSGGTIVAPTDPLPLRLPAPGLMSPRQIDNTISLSRNSALLQWRRDNPVDDRSHLGPLLQLRPNAERGTAVGDSAGWYYNSDLKEWREHIILPNVEDDDGDDDSEKKERKRDMIIKGMTKMFGGKKDKDGDGKSKKSWLGSRTTTN